MQETKLINILSLLTKAEFKQLGLFLRSPYFNRLNNVTKLYQELKKFYPLFNSTELTKEKIFTKIFPEEKYNDVKIRALQSYLFSLTEKFIAIGRYEKNPAEMRLGINEEMKKKGAANFMRKNVALAKQAVDSYPIHDAEYYQTLYRVTFEENFITNQFSNKREIQKEADLLTTHYLIMMLRTYATAYNRMSSLTLEVDSDLADRIESMAQIKPYANIPAVEANLALYMVARYMDEKHFFRFLEITKENRVLKNDDLYDAYYFLVNFCVLKIQQGLKKFIKVKFGLYRDILEKDLWKAEGHLSYVIFNNAVSSAFENNDTFYAKEIIDKYQNELEPAMKDDMTEFSYARFNFITKNYDEALNHLAKIKGNDDVFFRFAIRDMYIKIYYEAGHYENIYSLIDSYKHFLNSNKLITPDVKARYGIYLNNLNELLKVKANPTKKAIKQMRENILTTGGFVNKDWIAEKLSEIK